jgi:hypothetical protein
MKKSIFLFPLLMLGMLMPARADNLVVNPGFESGLSSWLAQNFGIADSVNFPGFQNTGVNSVVTGCVGPDCVSTYGAGAFVAQVLNTVAGQSYTLSFFVTEDSGPTSEMSVWWDGAQVADVLNPNNNGGPTGWLQFTYTNLLATSNLTVFAVNGRQDPGGLYFDDFNVDVTQPSGVPEPMSFMLAGAGLAAVGLVRRKRSRSV